jgi:hypothetical protein
VGRNAKWTASLLLAIGALFALWLLRERVTPPVDPVQSSRRAVEPATPAAAVATTPLAHVSRQAGPRATAPAAISPDAGSSGSANPAVFAGIVGFQNSFAVSKALSLNADAAEANLDKLCDEARKAPLLHGEGGADAADFMAPRMDYEAPLDKPPGALHLPDELRSRISSYGAEWPTRISAADLAGLDFGWLTELAQFDRWTVLTAGRLREVPAGNALYYPIPNYSSLMHWAKLRLALGLRRGDAVSAAAEVRHLVKLIRSQRLLISEMVSIAMLRSDVRAREVAAAARADLTGWEAIDPVMLDSQRRASFASMYFTYPGVREETLRKASHCMPSPCSALIEGVVAARSYGRFGARDNLPLIRELYAANGCEPAMLERMDAARELDPGEALELAVDDLPEQIAKHLNEPPR